VEAFLVRICLNFFKTVLFKQIRHYNLCRLKETAFLIESCFYVITVTKKKTPQDRKQINVKDLNKNEVEFKF